MTGQIKKELPPLPDRTTPEKAEKYKNEPPLVWRLLTTISIESLEQAKEVVEIYKLRWRVEEFFKLLKSDCYDIENTELTKGKSIRKLILYVMKASVKIQQLKAARDGSMVHVLCIIHGRS